jgi:hypothetical protein
MKGEGGEGEEEGWGGGEPEWRLKYTVNLDDEDELAWAYGDMRRLEPRSYSAVEPSSKDEIFAAAFKKVVDGASMSLGEWEAVVEDEVVKVALHDALEESTKLVEAQQSEFERVSKEAAALGITKELAVDLVSMYVETYFEYVDHTVELFVRDAEGAYRDNGNKKVPGVWKLNTYTHGEEPPKEAFENLREKLAVAKRPVLNDDMFTRIMDSFEGVINPLMSNMNDNFNKKKEEYFNKAKKEAAAFLQETNQVYENEDSDSSDY